ncbi:MAG: hypothetical protein EA369_09190 [Bradymonadales bacterium]|nr:MAG: hypothetical protein EA369_09190 [Bradymonadales bacterium]
MSLPNYAIHFTRPGDTFDRILLDHYGYLFPPERDLALRSFCADNGIYNEQLLFLSKTVFVRLEPRNYLPLTASQRRELSFYRQVINSLPEELRILVPVFHYTNLVLAASAPVSNALSEAQQTLQKISNAYLEYREAARLNHRDRKLYKSRYDRTRRNLIANYESRQGRLISRVFARGFKPINEINLRGRGRQYSGAPINREFRSSLSLGEQIERFSKAKYLLRAGGIFYTGAHVRSVCKEAIDLRDIDRHRSNRVLFQAGVAAGSAAVVTIFIKGGAFLIFGSTPVGWVAGIGIAIAAGAGAAYLGHLAGPFYDRSGQRVDLVEGAYLGDVCEFVVNPIEATRSLTLP